MDVNVLPHQPSLSPLLRARYKNGASVMQPSSALQTFARSLSGVNQQPICRPKGPINGCSAKIGSAEADQACFRPHSRYFFLIKKVTLAGRRASPRSGPGAPPAPLGFGLGPIATQPRRAGPRAHNLALPGPHPGALSIPGLL